MFTKANFKLINGLAKSTSKLRDNNLLEESLLALHEHDMTQIYSTLYLSVQSISKILRQD